MSVKKIETIAFIRTFRQKQSVSKNENSQTRSRQNQLTLFSSKHIFHSILLISSYVGGIKFFN